MEHHTCTSMPVHTRCVYVCVCTGLESAIRAHDAGSIIPALACLSIPNMCVCVCVCVCATLESATRAHDAGNIIPALACLCIPEQVHAASL